MCRRFVALSFDDALEVALRVEAGLPMGWEPDWPARSFEAFPGSRVPLLVPRGAAGGACVRDAAGAGAAAPAADGDCLADSVRAADGPVPRGAPAAEGAFQGVLLGVEDPSWGFPVEWKRSPVFNTRIETALSPRRTMWSGALRDGRCLVPALAFYESHETETVPSARTGRPVKRQYRFAAPDGAGMLLAGICSGGFFSLVTTEANADVAGVHARMPLVLRAGEARAWLEGDCARLADRSRVALAAAPEDAPASGDGPHAAGGAEGGRTRASGRHGAPAGQLPLF